MSAMERRRTSASRRAHGLPVFRGVDRGCGWDQAWIASSMGRMAEADGTTWSKC
jgi:hypothetical protein